MPNLDSIKRKISALLAKAQGTDNEHEAEAFMAKAYELLDEHQINVWELRNEEDPFGKDTVLEESTAAPTWRRHLLHAVALYYGASTVRSWKAQKWVKTGPYTHGWRSVDYTVTVEGRESARITTLLMYPYIVGQTKVLAQQMYHAGHYPRDVNKLQLRICNALVGRIYTLVNERKQKAPPAAQSRALVVVNELESWLKDAYPGLRDSIVHAKRTTAAAKAAADKVSLYRQLKLG